MTILFDMDGTLIDSTPAIVESFDEAFRAHGESPRPHQDIAPLIGHTLEDMFVALGVSPERAPSYRDAYKAHYRTVATLKTTLIDSAREAVELASSFAKLGVVTTKTGLYTKEILEHFGLLRYFGVVIGREDVEHPKPHPEPIIKALAALGESTQNAYLIGDTVMDLQAARAAHIGSVSVLCGYGAKEELMLLTAHLESSPLRAVTLIKTISADRGDFSNCKQ
jgi:phosphoglycolate phosphatase